MTGRARNVARVLLPLVAAAGLTSCISSPLAIVGPPCHAVAGSQKYALDADQAANAATIAAVGTRLDMPAAAVVVALAAALQESKLYNLPYGDLDSLGLFQQRPSEGWGTPAEILTPRYAAAAFFDHLANVYNWQDLSVTDAAQAVQGSAAPDAYAQWAPEAATLAESLTGEVPAAFVCRITPLPPPAAPGVMATDLTADLGPPALGAPLDATRGWQVAGWLIAHAGQYGVATVSFDGRRWSNRTGVWKVHQPGTNVVEVNA